MSSTRDHWLAFLALLPSDLTVYRGNVPAAPKYPYVLAGMGVGTREAETVSDEPSEHTNRYRITVAGLTEDSVMIVQDRTRDVLDRATPTLPGWSTARLRLNPLTPVLEDLTVSLTEGRHPFYAVDEYETLTTRV